MPNNQNAEDIANSDAPFDPSLINRHIQVSLLSLFLLLSLLPSMASFKLYLICNNRFMDVMQTNHAQLHSWSLRTKPDTITQEHVFTYPINSSCTSSPSLFLAMSICQPRHSSFLHHLYDHMIACTRISYR